MKKPTSLVFRNGTAILPDRLLLNATVLCQVGRSVAVGPAGKVRAPREAEIVDARGSYIAPGFVEMHVHSGDGADFLDGTAEAVRRVFIGGEEFPPGRRQTT